MRGAASLLLAASLAGCVAAIATGSLFGCTDQNARYREALAHMEALERQSDAEFDAARAHQAEILAPGNWPRDAAPAPAPAALLNHLDAAGRHMQRAATIQEQRIGAEREILALPLLDGAVDTRILFHMDLEAQQAKGELFAVTLEMYTSLLEKARTGDRDGYAALLPVYAAGIEAGNRRYQELDSARQEYQQKRLAPPSGAAQPPFAAERTGI
ncbi:MAG: hypothetical protein OEW11_10005 [Nitrospirota bacterium]|nr:hypothetical protein [Nitrospirota bacterium]